jgi:hypothetical protein
MVSIMRPHCGITGHVMILSRGGGGDSIEEGVHHTELLQSVIGRTLRMRVLFSRATGLLVPQLVPNELGSWLLRVAATYTGSGLSVELGSVCGRGRRSSAPSLHRRQRSLRLDAFVRCDASVTSRSAGDDSTLSCRPLLAEELGARRRLVPRLLSRHME